MVVNPFFGGMIQTERPGGELRFVDVGDGRYDDPIGDVNTKLVSAETP